jgi:hypothetical protein
MCGVRSLPDRGRRQRSSSAFDSSGSADVRSVTVRDQVLPWRARFEPATDRVMNCMSGQSDTSVRFRTKKFKLSRGRNRTRPLNRKARRCRADRKYFQVLQYGQISGTPSPCLCRITLRNREPIGTVRRLAHSHSMPGAVPHPPMASVAHSAGAVSLDLGPRYWSL